jgi:predicted RNA-binding protein with PUA-like domain
MKHWLLKTEPESYSIDDLKRDKKTSWDGVRNYQARNFIRDDMKTGDLILLYHSNAKPPGIVGIAKVCRDAYPDHTAQDPKDHHHDPKATKENPIWMMVDIQFVEKFTAIVSLDEIKAAKSLDGILVAKRGQRLSVQPVEKAHFDRIRKMAAK